ncbi:MAG: DUF192 domain-containing protein [Candidatus Daviesbacteria bacterium]|nr:DUF192 domain-containing protein [Candidatus Daviesbacteria bacterium]
MKKFILQSVLLIIGIIVALFFYKQNPNLSGLPFMPEQTVFKQLRINNAMLKVEIADTQAKRSKGLGGRQSLASDGGMLFVFPKPDKHPFWMKGLAFLLDFIWIREDLVVDISQNIHPPTPGQSDESLPVYESKEEVDKVLEVVGGTAQRLNIKVGDRVKIE